MIMKLFGGLIVAAGLIAAGIAGNTASTSEPAGGTCCSKGAACCSEDCCEGCPDCKCQCACCENCADGCECPNME